MVQHLSSQPINSSNCCNEGRPLLLQQQVPVQIHTHDYQSQYSCYSSTSASSLYDDNDNDALFASNHTKSSASKLDNGFHFDQPFIQMILQQVQPLSSRMVWNMKSSSMFVATAIIIVTMMMMVVVLPYQQQHSSSSSSILSMTDHERALLQHYYEPFFITTDITTTLSTNDYTNILLQKLRTAQQQADMFLQEMNTNNDNYVQQQDAIGDDVVVTSIDQSQQQDGYNNNMKNEDHPPVRHRSLSKDDQHNSKHHDKKEQNQDRDSNKDKDEDIPNGCETTIVILRHCEKELIAEHCAYNGYERSVYISTLFGNTIHTKYPKPTMIFAESPISRNIHSTKMNFREVETAGPLAQSLHIPIDDSYTDETIHELIYKLKLELKKGTYCGQVLVIVWKHTRIGEIAHWLGCGPTQGCPIDYSGKSFDQIWQIRHIYTNQFVHSTHKHHFLQHHHREVTPFWQVYGSIQYENFDPLAFSKLRGDYPPHNNFDDDNDGRKNDYNDDNTDRSSWKEEVVAYPERTFSTDMAGWKMTMLGLSKPED